MPMPVISVPQFPSVPNLPGVPAMLRAAGAFLPLPVVEIADGLGFPNALQAPQWGIFDQYGSPALVGDAVVGVEFQRDYQVPDYPVEDGSFASYNKVARPFGVKVGFTVGGSFSGANAIGGVLSGSLSGALAGISGTAAISTFLAALDAATASLDLYSVVTPEVSYPNVNLVHYDYRRESRHGATMLHVDVWCEEVRITATAQFSNTQSPNGADPTLGGTVQTAPVIPVTQTPLPPLPDAS